MKEIWTYYYGFGKTKKVEFVLELLNLVSVTTGDSRYYEAVILVTPGVVSFADKNNLSAEDLSLLISNPAANLVFRTIDFDSKESPTVYCTFIEK